MQILKPHSRSDESESLGLLFVCVFTNQTGDSDAHSHFGITLPACEPKLVHAPSNMKGLDVGWTHSLSGSPDSLFPVLQVVRSGRDALFWWITPGVWQWWHLGVWHNWGKDICLGGSSSTPPNTLNSPQWGSPHVSSQRRCRVIHSYVSIHQTICFNQGLPSEELHDQLISWFGFQG